MDFVQKIGTIKTMRFLKLAQKYDLCRILKTLNIAKFIIYIYSK